jgi:hypothetical protein
VSDLVFAAGNALITKRSVTSLALSDLAGLFVTELAP